MMKQAGKLENKHVSETGADKQPAFRKYIRNAEQLSHYETTEQHPTNVSGIEIQYQFLSY
jgi:hypothetical protein